MKPFDELRAASRIRKHQQHQAAGTTTDRDLPDYDRIVNAIIGMGYTPARARQAAAQYLEAANETLGGPNVEHFLNMVRIAGLVEPPADTD